MKNEAHIDRVLLTRAGEERLQAELQLLRRKTRPAVIAAIAEARGHGDLKENAEYHAAREQQSFVEGRIRELEAKLSIAEIIDSRLQEATGRVVFGATLLLQEEGVEKSVSYQLVGPDEADLKAGRLAFNTPVGRAFMGHKEGDEVIVDTPSGERCYRILAIRYD